MKVREYFKHSIAMRTEIEAEDKNYEVDILLKKLNGEFEKGMVIKDYGPFIVCNSELLLPEEILDAEIKSFDINLASKSLRLIL